MATKRRQCSVCGLPGHTRRSHRRNSIRVVRRNLDAFTDKHGIHPIRGSPGYDEARVRATRPTKKEILDAARRARVEDRIRDTWYIRTDMGVVVTKDASIPKAIERYRDRERHLNEWQDPFTLREVKKRDPARWEEEYERRLQLTAQAREQLQTKLGKLIREQLVRRGQRNKRNGS